MKSLLVLLIPLHLMAQAPDATAPEHVRLPNGWGITQVGVTTGLGDLPLNLALSPDRRFLAVTNNGQSVHSLQLIDVASGRCTDTLEVPSAWYGLVWSHDGSELYASGGNANAVWRCDVSNGRLTLRDSLVLGKPWPEKISVAGLALDDTRHRLYAVTKEDRALYVVDTRSRRVLHHVPLGGEGYACLLSPDGSRLYISCWGCDRVVVVNAAGGTVLTSIPVGDNPNAMALRSDGAILYVANANDNSVSVIDTRAGKVVETLDAALFPGSAAGSTTNALALDSAGTTLAIANADNNCLALFDVTTPGSSRSMGFIPTGWYPTAVAFAHGNILVANGKGFTSLPNPGGPNPARKGDDAGSRRQYIGGMFTGTLSIIGVPDQQALARYSRMVYENTPYTKEKEGLASGEPGNPVPVRAGQPSPITHVFYIIKENRTYDQVLGDMPGGNGDTTLLLFGERVTPNLHALAGEFVLLDNFYVDGEVSADGHNWSLGAYATDYLEKTWPTAYGGRGGSYDAEGTRAIANNKAGFLWDFCKRAGVSYRTYGEFADDYKPNIPSLEGHFCPTYTSWDQTVMDTTRFRQWKTEFDSLLVLDAVPRLNTLRFINDHTEGLRFGRPTPFAAVADNDLAVGLFVEHLSRSPIWKESVVFVVEDDAQNGPDHVDAHRTTAYVAGGYVHRRFIDHTMYSTSSILRTIELILGLPPMSQYDAAAEPMWRCFRATPDTTAFHAVPPRVDLFEKNTARNEWQRKSEEFNFGKEDRVPDALFNEVLWGALRGEPSPAPRRAGFVQVIESEADDEAGE
jgi:YVTN family beta-propeller protein